MVSSKDERWTQSAISLAVKGVGLTRPNPPVGAVVVRNGVLVGFGYHRKAGGAHAEVIALREAGDRAKGASLYVTLEPCSTQGRTPPCTGAVIDAGVSRLVCAVRDPNPGHRGRGLRMLEKAGLKVVEGVCATEAGEILKPFAKWIVTGKPYITLKLAMTVDGRIADATGRSKWISGAKARSKVQKLRREADAVLVGARTALLDDPSLLYRSRRSTGAFRVVVDSRGSVPLSAQVLSDGHANRTIIATSARCSKKKLKGIADTGAMVWSLPAVRGGVSMASLAGKLGKLGLLHVLCEGGGELASSMIKAGLVDRYVLFIAPRVMGGRDSIPAVGGKGWRLPDAPQLKFTKVEQVGGDIMVTAVPK